MNQLFKYDPNGKNNNQWKLAVVALVGLLFLSKILSLFF